MFYPEYPKRIALKRMIDLDSYEEFNETPFSKDKKHVYYVRSTSDGGQRFLIKSAKPKTFTPIKSRWSKDERNVYWENKIIKGVDLKSFKVDEADPNSAIDNKWVYLDGQRTKKNNR